MHNHSYESEFNLHVTEMPFSYAGVDPGFSLGGGAPLRNGVTVTSV